MLNLPVMLGAAAPMAVYVYDSQSRRLCYTGTRHVHAIARRCLDSPTLRLFARSQLAHRRENMQRPIVP